VSIIVDFAVALIQTFLIGRLCLWLLKRMEDAAPRILIAHAISFAICLAAATVGHANGGDYHPFDYLFLYLIPQLIWLTLDFVRLSRRKREGNVAK
jgi:hypothetical protein